MVVRKFALLVLLLMAFPAFAQEAREKRQIGPDEIKALQEQLAAIAALQGKTPEEIEKLMKLFEGKFGDLPNKFPNGIPKPPQFGPNMRPPEPPPPPRIGPPDAAPPPNIVPPQPNGDPFNPERPRPFDPGGNFNPPGQFDPKLNEHPGVAEMAKFWEQNFGPLEKTPAVRDALIELFEMSKDGKLMDGEWKGMWDDFKMDGQNADGMADWLKEMNFQGGKWDMPDWGKGWDMKWGGGNWGGGRWGGGGGGGNWGGGNWGGGGWGGGGWSGVGGAGGSWLPVILLVAFAVIGLIVWKFWPMIKNRESSAAVAVRALGRWPVDPRTIASREELVRAFEYLSILLCGDAARVWNHLTIARALRKQIPSSDLIADELAKLYELARYTPADEAMSPGSLADARRCLCHLAGVSV